MDTRAGRGLVPSETALVARAQDGDVVAFEALVNQHQLGLYRFAFRMLHDRGEAEDAVQDTLVTAWRRLPTLTDREAFQPWLYQVAHRRCLSLIRAREGRPTPTTELDTTRHDTQTTNLTDPAQQAEDAAQGRSLDALVADLPVDLRACWVLNEVNGMTYPEIGHALGLPVSTVRGRIARARHRLAEGMSQWR